MKPRAKLLPMFLFAACATTAGLPCRERATLLEQFEFQGQKYAVYDRVSRAASGLTLAGRTSIDLSAGMPGENIMLGTRTRSGSFYVFWLNRQQKVIRLAFYDQRRGRSRLLPLTGFSFIGLPEVIEENDGLQGLVFLGNRSHNDDLFYYEPKRGRLTALTDTPFSEKGFTLLEKDGRLEIETRSLWARYRYRFDPWLRESILLEERRPGTGQKRRSAAVTPDYVNTYIGFGDSVTWGEIEGVQRLDLCYLAQMQTLLADPGYEFYYGASNWVNLGVPGDTTLAGAERVERDLDEHSGLYFLLMLGVNDVIHVDLSVDSSLENLGYIIDAATARGMRVIISTLTPSKAGFSEHQFYWDNLHSLSNGIIALAREKNVPSIDPLTLFLNTNPPDGWRDLLENIIPGLSSGNHPNAAGHRLIASLFAPALVTFPPQPPRNVNVIDPDNTLHRTASWSVNYESDFDHFHVEFGFQPGALDYSLDAPASYCTFNLFPFLPELYFRVRAVDRGGRQSEPASQGAAAAATGLGIKEIN
jgi:lysophospholipase L1-like esterase